MTSAETGTASSARDAAPLRPRWKVLLIRPETMTLALLVIAFVVAGRLSPYFSDTSFILESATYYAEFAIVALVLTLVIIAGEIDLSPASNMALSACIFASCFKAGLPIGLCFGLGLLAGLAMGLFNALLVIGFQLPSIIVTIGTLTLYRGLAQVLAGDKSIGHFPKWFNGIDYRLVFGLPVPIIVFVLLSVILAVVLGATIIGRQIYQVGTNETAARYAGIRVRRIKVGLFVLMGLVSAVAGLITSSRLASVRYDMASGGELQMVLMVLLGGTYIFGGRGSILGTFLAAWLLVIIATGMTVANVAVTSQLIVMGLLLIVSIIATNAIYSRAQR
jgi:rhamnose transport system permease protein